MLVFFKYALTKVFTFLFIIICFSIRNALAKISLVVKIFTSFYNKRCRSKSVDSKFVPINYKKIKMQYSKEILQMTKIIVILSPCVYFLW